MKLLKANLLSNVTGTYDQTKTTIVGRVSQKTFGGSDYLGPPLSKFNDCFTDLGFAPLGPIFKTSNNRIFVPFFVVAGTIGIALYNHDPLTNVNTYVGQIRFNMPNLAATTHTIRGFKVIDTGTTNWKIYVSTTGSVVYNGGNFLLNKIDLADFIASPPTFGFGNDNDQKAVYKIHDSNALYSTSVNITVAAPGKVQFTAHPYYVNDTVIFVHGTVPTGLALNTTYFVRNPTANDFELSLTSGGASITTTGSSGTANISLVYGQTSSAASIYDSANNRLLVHNGVAATHQYYVFDTSVAPTYSQVAGLVIDETTDVINHTAHPYQNNDQLTLFALTGGAGLTNGSTYFVRNATANTYQLSLTSGGAAINITTAGTVTLGRAFGITGASFLHKTANLNALTGTLIALDSEDYATPGHSANSGFPCAFFSTTTNLYLGKLSELTAGATTWPSLLSSNIFGTTNQITGPTISISAWSNVLDAAIYVTNGAKFVIKKVINNQIEHIFGELNNKYYEGFAIPETVALGLITVTGIDLEDGVAFIVGGTVGQRGFTTVDLRSDCTYDYSYIVTPVLDTPSSVLEVYTSVEKFADSTGNIKLQYRTSGFGSISGGWIDVPSYENLNSLAAGAQWQGKICFQMQSEESSSPAQIRELYLGIQSLLEISDNWEFSREFSDNNSPSKIVFRLKKAYVGAVPTLYLRYYDLSDSLLGTLLSTTDAANYKYSTDFGTSWNPLGTIPNTVGTFIEITLSTPPGVDIRPSLKES